MQRRKEGRHHIGAVREKRRDKTAPLVGSQKI